MNQAVLKNPLSMTKRKRTEKSKYKHQSTGDHCTCSSYLAELMCLRLAEYKNEGNLTYKFWNKKSCGEALYLKKNNRKGYQLQSEERYRLEPEIISFADFLSTKGKKVLEIGCGTGLILEEIAKRNTDIPITGID